MTESGKISVVFVLWKRIKDFEDILKVWLKEVDQVIVLDNSGGFKTDLDVLVLSSNQNLNSKWRFMVCQLCRNDTVILSDDDIFPKPGIAKDLLRFYDGKNVTGIMGKQFTGDKYYDSTGVRSNLITQPTKVDYLCSNLVLTSRKNCLVDCRDIPLSLMDDWWWEHELKLDLLVVPTDKWESLPEQKYEFAQHLDPDMKDIREYYFKKWIKHENPPLRDTSKFT
jgi:hypothetical protein